MLTRVDFVAIAAVSSKWTCYAGYLKESEIRTSHSLVPLLIFLRPLTASPDWSCFLFSAIMGSQTMQRNLGLYTLVPSQQFLLTVKCQAKKSVLQGDTEAPFLFVTVFDWVLHKWDNKKNRLHSLKKPKVNWTCSAWWPRKLVYTLSLQRPNLLFVIFHTRVFSSKEKISRMSKILISQYVHCIEPERHQVPERKSIECIFEIGSCLEVSFIILTKGSSFQSISFNCPLLAVSLGS